MHLDYLTLPVADPAAVADWYRTHLDAETAWEGDDFVMVAGDAGARLGLHLGAPLADPGAVQLHFAVDDVDAAHERLAAAGVAFDGPPAETPWGYRVATTADPAGHTVELVERG